MRERAFHSFCVAAGLLLLGNSLWGQSGTANDKQETSQADSSHGRTHLGYVQDWSTRHLVMPGTRIEDVMASGKPDPRLVYNMMRRRAALQGSQSPVVPLRPKEHHPVSKIDWSVSLENGYIAPDEFPAKFSFDIDTQDCRSDFVLFALTVNQSTISQATVVGINNLYTAASPTCNGGSPSIAFAYNTQTQVGGQIFTSPTLSADGTKVAFVETTATASYFHVLVLPDPLPLPSSPDGTVLIPITPTTCTAPNTQGCMTTLTFSSTSDSISSPWIDYASDTAYVADDNGILYKIRPVFGGPPALSTDTADWPVTVSESEIPLLTDPIVDTKSGLVFLGDLDGYLYSVSLTSPAKTISAVMDIGDPGSQGGGLVDPPIVVTDPANPTVDQVFAFTGCSNLPNYGGAVTQVPANFTSSTVIAASNTVNLTVARSSGIGTCIVDPPTSGNIHDGAFDNAFYLYGSTSGHLIACGFNSGGGNASEPRIYMLPFADNEISTWIASYKPDATAGDVCSPLTEFYNSTTGADGLFYGVGNAYTRDTSPDGFVETATINPASFTAPSCTGAPTPSCVTAPASVEGVSGVIIDNDLSNGGSNIYFTTLAPGSVNGQTCPSGLPGGIADPYCAVQLSQSDLD